MYLFSKKEKRSSEKRSAKKIINTHPWIKKMSTRLPPGAVPLAQARALATKYPSKSASWGAWVGVFVVTLGLVGLAVWMVFYSRDRAKKCKQKTT